MEKPEGRGAEQEQGKENWKEGEEKGQEKGKENWKDGEEKGQGKGQQKGEVHSSNLFKIMFSQM